jgi:hypothetical protein
MSQPAGIVQLLPLKDLLPVCSAKMREGSRSGYLEDLIGAFVYFASDAIHLSHGL